MKRRYVLTIKLLSSSESQRPTHFIAISLRRQKCERSNRLKGWSECRI
jgi:hypothetical protein